MRIGRFSHGIERLPRSARSNRVGTFADGIARTTANARVGSFADGYLDAPRAASPSRSAHHAARPSIAIQPVTEGGR
jgi:hypothetical protein